MLSVTIPNINPSQNTPVLPNIRRIVTRPSGASCSRRNSAKLSLATIRQPHSVIGDFDQVLVGVADIDGLDRADCAGARAGAGYDRNLAALQMRDDFGERRVGDEAQIAGAGGRPIGDQPGDVVGGMEVDLLLPEAQRGAPL